MIWFLEGQSSQREIVIGAREALPADVRIIASHRQDRPEITRHASLTLCEPVENEQRIAWVIHTALEHQVSVVLAGRIGRFYEASRSLFEAAGITLVTGGMSLQTFDQVDDKSRFTVEGERAGLAVVPAITATSAAELVAAYEALSASGEVCIKPAVGIYGQGFWRFKAGVDAFRCFANPDAREVEFATYLRAYTSSAEPAPLLVMPYMAGDECSVDMVCEAGRVIASVGRRKSGLNQFFERDTAAVELAIKAAEHFGCDGIVNVQTKDDAYGRPHLLEINPRYSGGIGYTRETGTNLPGIFAARRLGLPEPLTHWRDNVRVKAITVAVPV